MEYTKNSECIQLKLSRADRTVWQCICFPGTSTQMVALITGYWPQQFLLHAVFLLVCFQMIYFFFGTIRTIKQQFEAAVITISKQQAK